MRFSNTQGYYVEYLPTDNQTFDCTTFVWEVLTIHGNKFRIFMGQGIPPTLIVHVVGTIFYVFSYDAVSDQDSNLSPPPRRTDGLGLLGNLLCIILSKRPVWPGRGSATNINTKKPEK